MISLKIIKRYEVGSTIISTNKVFEHWSDIFDDNVLADAIKAREVHHVIIFYINGLAAGLKPYNH